MPWQLIFTSAPRTLSAGQSGYGTVARSADLREGLAQRLEQLSYYGHATDRSRIQPVICAYRILDLRGTKYHVLSRIQDAGLDFTHRTNHIAHHLVFAPSELPSAPPPAIIFQHWNGWLAEWSGEPRLLGENDWGNFSQLPKKATLPAQSWQHATGDAGSAAALLERHCANGCYLLADEQGGTSLLALFAESLQLLDPAGQSPGRLWQYPFTTQLQAEDLAADFCWRGCSAEMAAQRGNDAPVIVVGTLRAPAGPLAQLARQGLAPIPKPIIPLPPVPVAAAAAPVDAPAIPKLSLQGTSRRIPIQGLDEASLTKSARSSKRQGRSVTIDFSSPRLLWPAIGLAILVVLLFTGFVWPGFLKSRQPAKPTTPKAQSVQPKKPSPDDLTIVPDTQPVPRQPEKAAAEPHPPPAPPSQAAVRQLRESLATIELRTYFHFCDSNQDRVAFLPGKELESLLKAFFKEPVPLDKDAVECLVEFDSLQIVTPRQPALPLKVDFTGGNKSISAVNDAGRGFTLSAAEWLKDPRNPVTLTPAGAPKVLNIVLRPKAGQNSFAAFRIVAAFEQAPPIQLSRSLLLSDRGSFDASLGPDLLVRWRALVRDGVAGFQLRPSAKGDAKQDLLELQAKLPAALRPAAGAELDFTKMRQGVSAELGLENARASDLGRKVLELNRQIEEAKQRHVEIGKLLGIKDEHLASFSAYTSKLKREPGRRTFETYLAKIAEAYGLEKAKDFIPGKDDRETEAAAVVSLAKFHAALVQAGGHKALATVPQDYFSKRWLELGVVHERDRQRQALAKAQQTSDELKSVLEATPASLDETPEVRLVLKRPGGVQLLFIRFTAKP